MFLFRRCFLTPLRRRLMSFKATASVNVKPVVNVSENSGVADVSALIGRLRGHLAPLQLNLRELDASTLVRLAQCSSEFVSELAKALSAHRLIGPLAARTLCSHEDWRRLSTNVLAQACSKMRSAPLNLEASVYLSVLAGSPAALDIDATLLAARLKVLKNIYFTSRQLRRLLCISPNLLTTIELDGVRYRFNYVFALMGVKQNEICRTRLFDWSIEHVRARHLFLARAGFYERPNKKGVSRVQNPKLRNIIDTTLDEYLRVCTHGHLNVHDYETFCAYMREENFDNELLGFWIDRITKNEIIRNMEIDDDDDDGDED